MLWDEFQSLLDLDKEEGEVIAGLDLTQRCIG